MGCFVTEEGPGSLGGGARFGTATTTSPNGSCVLTVFISRAIAARSDLESLLGRSTFSIVAEDSVGVSGCAL
ncbi:hypothetical protein STCU_10225 [Strigomonas culicis]|uniref:Uncharacterized protein n=1 Tax=Strigomonas culicis TaxID=28005 RepID=S9V586_9TRYP|nr:hypothetical protein STCU_10225 [Strigomonas culicis]|eukprot:EPY18040.1 hypothetical protein STCU_10225 [Strigomonas culicis]